MNKASPQLLLALALALLAGCGGASDTGSVQLTVSVPQALAESVTRVSVTASADDLPAISVELVATNETWGGLLGNLPAGAGRAFLAQAFDASNSLLFQGSASDISIVTGQTALVAITVQQVSAPPPFLNEAPLIDSLGSSSTTVAPGGSLSLTATAHDPNASDTLTHAWSATGGSFASTSAASTTWTAPLSAGIRTLTFTVTDSQGLASSLSLSVYVTPSGG